MEKYTDWAVSERCKHQGMSWSPQGVLALAARQAARCNGELDDWRRDRVLPELGYRNRFARPLDRETGTNWPALGKFDELGSCRRLYRHLVRN